MGFSDFALDLKNPDFGKLADAFGAHYMKVEKADIFSDTVAKGMRQKGITLIEVLFEYPDDVE